jgi:hypothetical protein
VVRLKDATARVQRIRTQIKPTCKKQAMAFLRARLGIPGGIEPSSWNLKFFLAKNQKIAFGIGIFLWIQKFFPF